MQVHPSVNVGELRKGIEDDLHELAAPLVNRLETVDSLIAERVADLGALREVRGELVKTLRPLIGEDAIPLEPGRSAKPGPRPKPKPNPTGGRGHKQVSEKKIDLALDLLRRDYNGNEFTTKDVGELVGVSRNAGQAVVKELVEREQVVMARIARSEPGMPRYYKVVT